MRAAWVAATANPPPVPEWRREQLERQAARNGADAAGRRVNRVVRTLDKIARDLS